MSEGWRRRSLFVLPNFVIGPSPVSPHRRNDAGITRGGRESTAKGGYAHSVR